MDNKQLLHAYLNGTATKEQVERLKAVPEYADYIKISEAAEGFNVPEFDEEGNLKAIHEQLEEKPKVRRLNPWSTVLKIAAVFVLIFAGYTYFNSLETTVQTAIAEKQHLTLPDGSEVVLNARSSIEYNKNKWEKNRQLELTGEAYFEVEKGKRFIVNTEMGTVSVLGTHFNVFAREDMLNVFCYEGLVSVAFNDTLIKLPGGNGIKLIDGKIVERTQNKMTGPSWIANESSFNNVTLSTVLKELQRQYHITVNTPNEILDKRFSGSFPHDNLDLALRLICEPLNLTYKINEDQIIIHEARDN